VVLFNRGNRPAPPGVEQIQGDRQDASQLTAALANQQFDAIFDNNGRELSDTQPLVELFNGRVQHFVYVSSAGVYRQSDQMPHREGDPIDPKSRHLGKHHTEAFLQTSGIPFTSVRPVYIYGPQNYNDIEAWFFDRIVRDRPVPIPDSGLQLTQLGHVQDLAQAMVAILGNAQAIGQIYNISGDRYVTFDGLARLCAEATGRSGEGLKIVHYDPSAHDLGKRKAFPLRSQHFFTAINKAQQDLNWQPHFDLLNGLKNSFEKDYLTSGRDRAEIDFSVDDIVLAELT
jgi:nucleoside-diphosphate-sugar epimerase